MPSYMYVTFLKLFSTFLYVYFVLNGQYYLGALFILLLFILISVQRRQASANSFSAILASTIDVATFFIVIAALGYQNILSWSLAAPLLVLSFLVNYMRLRKGIAGHSQSTAQLTKLETLLFPSMIILILLSWNFTESLAAIFAGLLLAGFSILTIKIVASVHAQEAH